ncbi:nicotinate-nucleotide--dimethylbenzimidazole phosphoribosyltransferase [Nocardioides sp. Root151]|uniref:nicotinate-nucleotide--dimethylbenzimidazole phosphoribosyltransferase n=1 Tax=Nocardioides sp. Root151 TaxID=1736475 RepID=UPI00070317B3|nr:nicotinate-nucleotide--dimethylbenzimidazole phosphoribosyltransferase [Nocardioides sp. Root151]KQZ70324.1 nicotinate-nucleotide--dimethylbenzimidazole phosphoribosyltransferase [Nocardioides sp. Root151]
MNSPRTLLDSTLAAIRPPSAEAAQQARDRQAQLTKPAGALGVLEEVSIQLAGIAGTCPPPAPAAPAVAVFAGDHGVLAQGVSPWPQEVTVGMVENFRAGGAAVNVLARACGAVVRVVDVGVASEIAGDEVVLARNVRRGTGDLSVGPAMTRDEAEQAISVGIEVANLLADAGHDVLLTGDMGIGNTTPSACLLAALTGTPAEVVTGRGTGIDDETLALKTRVVADAVARLSADADPVDVLAEVGGLEHAGLVGFILGAAARRLPVILDGVIAGSAALVAQALSPDSIGYCLAGHRSVEPGHRTALEKLGLRPLVDLDLRLGEGSGAALAFPLVRSAALILDEMATFDSAGVANKDA